MKLQCSSSYPEFFCWTLNPFKKMFVFFGVQFSTSDIISINTLPLIIYALGWFFLL